MYRFLDRPAANLDDDDLFLLSAMRSWVTAVRGGRCACAGIVVGFTNRGIPEAARSFLCVMHLLDRHSHGTLCFAPIGYDRVGDDEARMLTLFAFAQDQAPLSGLTAALVVDDVTAHLASAVIQIADALRDHPRMLARHRA